MINIYPSRELFLEKAAHGNVIPVYGEFVADTETPVSAFKKVGGMPYSFLLESVEGGETVGRYSFVGTGPRLVVRAKNESVEISHPDGRVERTTSPQPLDALRQVMRQYRFVADTDLPPFCGGAVGYVSYDAVRYLENIGSSAVDDLGLPDLYFMITDTVLIFDHVRHRLQILSNAVVDDTISADEAYDQAVSKIHALREKLRAPLPPPTPAAPAASGPGRAASPGGCSRG